jgi:1-acyl-sn-glycerol-3-phosphate acyltransferase
VPIIPIYMHGLGKALPKGSTVLVPFNCTVNVGAPLYGTGTYNQFVEALQDSMTALGAEERKPVWD